MPPDAFAAAAVLLFGAALLQKLFQQGLGGALVGAGAPASSSPPAAYGVRRGALEDEPSLLDIAGDLSDDPEAFIASIPQLAETHRKIAERESGTPAEYDAQAFERTDAFITAEWSEREMLTPEATLALVGSYVGECIRRLQGGTWGYTAAHGYHLDGVGGNGAGGGARIYPFVKVAKRFENGMDDSLAHYYWSLSLLLERARAKHGRA